MSPLATTIMPWLAIAALSLPSSSRDGRAANSTTAALAFLTPSRAVVVPRRRRPLRRPPADGNDDVVTRGAPDRERRMRRRPKNFGVSPHHRTSSISASVDDDDDNWGGASSHDDDDDDIGRGREGGGEDPRLSAMRSILESSWDASSMGDVPSDPASAARAAAECVSNAMSSNVNVVIVDLRLPTYDVLEGRRAYDAVAVYDFGVALSDEMRARGLVRKCLLLARNGGEADEIGRAVESRRRRRRGGGTTTPTTTTTTTKGTTEGGVDPPLATDNGTITEEEADEFRRRLTSSWTSDAPSSAPPTTSSSAKSPDGGGNDGDGPRTAAAAPSSPSHRLWSTVGRDLDDVVPGGGGGVGGLGPDAFDRIVSAADSNARLRAPDEDALVILSPYDTTDVIALRRVLARYGRSRTIVIVNPRFETDPGEMDGAVLVYGMLPLVAASRNADADAGGGGGRGGGSGAGSGLRAVVMKRFPRDWAVYVDMYGDGFVEAEGGEVVVGTRDGGGGGGGGSERRFPSPEWIARRVQSHVEGFSRRRDV